MELLKYIKNWLKVHLLYEPVGGLWDETDERDFGANVIAGKVTKEDLVEEDFQTFKPRRLIHQKGSDFCVGCSKCYGKDNSEGSLMSWAGAYAMGCRALGYIPRFGISILQVMRGAVKYGTPEERLWPFTGRKSHDADWKKMPPSVLDNAMRHRDESFFRVKYQEEKFDRFDLFRGFLHKLKKHKIIIQTGADAHAITLLGQKTIEGELRIGGPDSYGLQKMNYRLGIRIDGFRWFNRREVNQMFNGYISFDMKRSLAEILNQYDGKAVKLENNKECYLVKEGKKHHLKNPATAWSHNTLLFSENFVFVLTEEEFNLIPVGEPATFEGGDNHEIILRILEELKRTDLINE